MATIENITGLDIGSSKIAITTCDLFEGGNVDIVAQVRSTAEGIDRGYIINPSKTQELLDRAWKQLTKKSQRKLNGVVVSIGGIGLQSQYVKTSIELGSRGAEVRKRDINDVIEKAELLFANKYPNKKILHLIPLSYKLDARDVLGTPLGMIGTTLEVKIVIVTAPEQHVETLVRTVESVGIAVDDVVAAPLADAAACLSYEQKKQGVVLVNVGAETTQISTFEHGLLTSIRVIPLGSNDVTNDLALGLTIPIEEADEIKKGERNNFSVKKVQDIIDARLADIIESVDTHLRSIKKSRLLPAGVVWTGDGSQMANINEYAKRMLGIPSSTFTFEVKGKRGNQKKQSYPSFSTSIGLCTMDEPSSDKESFSFNNILSRVKYWLGQLKP